MEFEGSQGLGQTTALTPPARARSIVAPPGAPPTAWCTAARDDVQAISTGIAGPCRPKREGDATGSYASGELFRGRLSSLAAGRDQFSVFGARQLPAYTPVRLPLNRSGSIAASSSACQVVSSNIR